MLMMAVDADFASFLSSYSLSVINQQWRSPGGGAGVGGGGGGDRESVKKKRERDRERQKATATEFGWSAAPEWVINWH